MTECATGSHVAGFFAAFVVFCVIHSVPLAFLFVRWKQRYYWGFFPAIFCTLGLMSALDLDSPCSLLDAEHLSVFLAATFYSIGYMALVFFMPHLHLAGRHTEALIPFILVLPLLGAAFAVVWQLMSIGRKRLLWETGRQLTLKDRLIEMTLQASVIILFGALFAWSETGQSLGANAQPVVSLFG